MVKFPCEYHSGCKLPCIRRISTEKDANLTVIAYRKRLKLVSPVHSEANSTDS